MSLRSLSNTGRKRREEEAQNLPPGASSQTDTLKTERVIIASNHQQDSPPMSHLPERERERVCMRVRVSVCVRGWSSSVSWWVGDRSSTGTAGRAKKERGSKMSHSHQTAALHHNKRAKHSGKAEPPATRATRKAPVFWSWVG